MQLLMLSSYLAYENKEIVHFQLLLTLDSQSLLVFCHHNAQAKLCRDVTVTSTPRWSLKNTE